MANPAIVPALIKGGAAIAGGAIASRGSSKAARAQTQAEEQRRALEQRMYEEDIARQEPFRQIGLANLNRLAALYGEGGEYARAPTLNELQMDPGYAFRLAEGQKALERRLAAGGKYFSGGALKAGTAFGQELSSQEYQNAYNRARQQRMDVTNALGGLADLGPMATSGMAAAGRGYATGAGQAMSNIGASRASGYMGQANALREALGGVVGAYGSYRGSGLSRQSLDEVLPEYKVTSRRY
jgi:hypothetical protein